MPTLPEKSVERLTSEPSSTDFDFIPSRESFVSDLPPRAQNLLRAAHRLLVEQGYEGLTWAKVARAAGEQKSMVGYYFGDKDSLILELLKLIGRDSTSWMVEQVEGMARDADRVQAFVQKLKDVTGRPASFAFFDVLPHAMRDENLRRPVAELYEWYRTMVLRGLGFAPGQEEKPTVEAIAWLFIAAWDGILIQRALNPAGYPIDSVYQAFESAIKCLVQTLPGGGAAAGDSSEERT